MACSALLPCALRAAVQLNGWHLRSHPAPDYKLSWLFFQCQHFRRSACGTIESVEAVQKGGPAKAQRSGFGGERRSSGTTELLPRKAKRRMRSLRRRGTPFSPIFRRATKDGATGGRQLPNAAGKKEKRKIAPPEVAGRVVRQVKPHNPSIAIKQKKHQRREQLRWCFSLRIGISPERSHIGTERKRGENRRWKHDADSCSHLTTSPAPVCE